MFVLDSLMISGIQWAIKTVITAAEAEMNDDTALRNQLLAAEMRRETGEMSDEEFAGIEADLLARIREIKERREGPGALGFGGGADRDDVGQHLPRRSDGLGRLPRPGTGGKPGAAAAATANGPNDPNDPSDPNGPNGPNGPNEIPVTDLTYVYCLVRSTRPPAVPARPAGMPGARGVRLLDAGGGLRLAVSAVPAADYDEAALALGLQNLEWVGRRAVAHEAVVEHFLTAPAVLPMQLFALFTSDERAQAHVARDRRRIDRILTRIERKHEWGLRLTFDEQSARRHCGAEPHCGAEAHGGEEVRRRLPRPQARSA